MANTDRKRELTKLFQPTIDDLTFEEKAIAKVIKNLDARLQEVKKARNYFINLKKKLSELPDDR